MEAVDSELLELTHELSKLGGSRKVKLSQMSVYIRGIHHSETPISNVNYISSIEENNQIIIRHPSCANDMRCYEISKYFAPSISNDKVTADIVNKITTSIFDGFNLNLITYGAINTGKTQLLFGSSEDNMKYDSCEGLLGTLCANLLRKIEQIDDKITISVSCWEIEKDKIVDLLQSKNKNQIQSPFEITAVTVSCWEDICSVWDISRYNSSNWMTSQTGYKVIPNESNLFLQIKLYNQTLSRVTTFNLIDLIGCHYINRSSRCHVTRQQIEKNKPKNVNLFSLNKLLHHLSNLHLKKEDKSSNIVENVISESLLNNFIGPMITQNSSTIILGTISCNSADYQSSLRTIQVLSRTLSIKVPCIHTPFNKHTQSSIISFQEFLSKWQSILYKHMMIEDSIQKQINQYKNQINCINDINDIDDDSNIKDIDIDVDNMTISIDDHESSTKLLDDKLQKLKKNIPQNTFQSNNKIQQSTHINNPNIKNIQNGSNSQIKQEISLLLEDILKSKHNITNIQNNTDYSIPSTNIEESYAFEENINPNHSQNIMDSLQNDADNFIENEIENETTTHDHLKFTNLRLENCKLKEELRKIKNNSRYSSIFEDYDREIQIMHKILESLSNDNKLFLIKNLQLKQEITNNKLINDSTNKNELKTVRILQKSLRDTKKQLANSEASLQKLTTTIRHTDIRNKVLQTSKDECYQMSQLLNKRENELAKSYLHQAQTQAIVDKHQLQITELEHEKHTLQIQLQSLENEVSTLRHLCKKVNDDLRQRNQLNRVSKKWSIRK